MPGPQDYRQLIAPLGKDKPAFTIQKRCAYMIECRAFFIPFPAILGPLKHALHLRIAIVTLLLQSNLVQLQNLLFYHHAFLW